MDEIWWSDAPRFKPSENVGHFVELSAVNPSFFYAEDLSMISSSILRMLEAGQGGDGRELTSLDVSEPHPTEARGYVESTDLGVGIFGSCVQASGKTAELSTLVIERFEGGEGLSEYHSAKDLSSSVKKEQEALLESFKGQSDGQCAVNTMVGDQEARPRAPRRQQRRHNSRRGRPVGVQSFRFIPAHRDPPSKEEKDMAGSILFECPDCSTPMHFSDFNNGHISQPRFSCHPCNKKRKQEDGGKNASVRKIPLRDEQKLLDAGFIIPGAP